MARDKVERNGSITRQTNGALYSLDATALMYSCGLRGEIGGLFRLRFAVGATNVVRSP
jgi:hypothetical protein